VARKKFGLLEKHKDYVERARDFHKKDNTIKHLKRKAEERNPDEFYFAMQKAKTKDGVHNGRWAVCKCACTAPLCNLTHPRTMQKQAGSSVTPSHF
jgi:hypothetical protein